MGTYSIIYLRKPETAMEVNDLLKENYNLKYKRYNEVDYGVFFTQEMFDEDLRFVNEDEEGKADLPHFRRPISKETYYSLLFGVGNVFGDIGTYCVKISSVRGEDVKIIRTLQEFSKTPLFKKYINLRRSKNLKRLLAIQV
ncbi:hypothetical protein CLU97_0036 [Chryseobacterium sp. 7]|uniref:hypothetical protein n=1 Tax=Chryseobacterium sp. 7 TaxID=2035214 RepID=UPI000EB4A8A8|nr:hypothetical protein [Chryseobacterium sp. 7]RLJ30666.1 hypothetical protein CLU97_0036 [Chryseobacterium sp. 7]